MRPQSVETQTVTESNIAGNTPVSSIKRIVLFPMYVVAIMAVSGCEHREAALEVDSHVVDVEYNDGKVIETTVVLENIGDRILKILEISPSCSCTVPRLKKWSLEPGERMDLVLDVTSPDLGDQEVEVIIRTNSLETPVESVKFHLKGPPLSLPRMWQQPPVTMIQFPNLADVTTTQIEVSTLEAAGSEPWISSLVTDEIVQADVSCKLVRVDNDNMFGKDCVARTYTFELVIQPHAFERFQLQLRMVAGAGDAQSTVGNCTLICDPAPEIRCLPSTLRFSRNNEATSENILVLASENEEPFEVDLTSDLAFCSVALDSGQASDNRSVVALKVLVDWEKVQVSDTGTFRLTLHTTHPKCKEIVVPLHLDGSDEQANPVQAIK